MACTSPGAGYVTLVTAAGDCNDNNDDINPGATEICNSIDDDCDGSTDEGLTFTTYYTDADGDGYGTGVGQSLCANPGAGFATQAGDCNDGNAAINPGATEICNSIDDDCDGATDEGLTFITYYPDGDGDGYGITGLGQSLCANPGAGYTTLPGDCHDGNAAINPGAPETCNGLDDNCSGAIDEGVLTTYYRDMDGDGFGNLTVTQQACSQPVGYVTNNTDCNDNSALEKPGQVWYKDTDGDNYAQTGAATITQCARPLGYKAAVELTSITGDCNDNAATINPGATEVCDGVDNDCDGAIDAADTNVSDNTPPSIACNNFTVTFNGQSSIALNASSLAAAVEDCGSASLGLSINSVSCSQVGQTATVTVTATNSSNLSSTCTSQVTIAGLPCGWSQDSDGVGCAGGNSVSYNSATQVYTATSTNCYYTAPYTSDETTFAERSFCGNGSIQAEITSITGGQGWAGIVLRESDAPGAKKVQLMTNLSSLVRREVRYTTGGTSYPSQFTTQQRYWLRLLRVNNQFIGYASADNITWSQVMAVTVSMNSCIDAGLVVTNYLPTSTVTATFAQVSVVGSPTLLEDENNLSGPSASTEAEALEVQLYPNPTSADVYLDLSQYLGRAVRVELYNLTGQLLQTRELDEVKEGIERLDLAAYQSGVYLIKVKTEGMPETVKRLIISKL